MSAPLHVKNAPPAKLVFTYLFAGLLSFVFLAGWTAFHYTEWSGFYANTRFLAWVHLAVLGWINLIIFGVLFQFIPVVLNARLGSERLAWWQLAFYLPGAAGMIACFWIGRLDWPLHTFASILWFGFFLFIWNMLVTYRQVKEWTLTAKYIYAAVLYLLVTIFLGLFLSIHVAYPMGNISHLVLLKVHAHMGFAGWFLMIIIGVSLKLLPMFLLPGKYSTRPASVAFYLLNAGLLTWGIAVGFGLSLFWQNAGLIALVSGIGLYLVQVAVIFRDRNRVKTDALRRHSVRRIEFPLRFAVVAFGMLVVVTLAGLATFYLKPFLSAEWHNRLILAYGATVFLGFLSLLMQAFLYKIVPFLIWIARFTHTAGRYKTPKIVDLVPAVSAVSQLAVYCSGATIAVLSLLTDRPFLSAAGAGIIFLSSLWLGANLMVAWKRAVPLGPLVSAKCEPPVSNTLAQEKGESAAG